MPSTARLELYAFPWPFRDLGVARLVLAVERVALQAIDAAP